MAKRKKKRAKSILMIRRRVRKTVAKEENIIHVSDSKIAKDLKEAKIKRIDTKLFVLSSLKFKEVKIEIITREIKSIIYKLNKIATNYISLKNIPLLLNKIYSLKISRDFFAKYSLKSIISSGERASLNELLFNKINVNILTPIEKRSILLQKLAFENKVLKIRLNVEKILTLLGKNMVDDFLLPNIDIGNIVFDRDLEALGLAGSKYVGEPFIIITDEDLWYVVAEICKEIYRESRGGYPKPHIISKEEELENLIDLGEKLNDRILIIKNSLEVFKGERKYYLDKIVMEMFSQGLGFLILPAESRDEEEKLLEWFSEGVDYIYKPKIVKALGEKLDDEEKASVLFNLMLHLWGLEIPLSGPSKLVLRRLFAELERRYKDFIDENLRFNKYLYKVKRHKIEPSKESEDHLALKVLTVKYLVEKLNISLDSIESEPQIDPKQDIIPDIYLKDRGIAVEVETLYETGASPILKIRDSILKYKNISEVTEIWVVIRNLPVFLHFKNLIRLLKMLRKEMEGRKIKFLISSIEHNTLRNLEEVKNDIAKKLLKDDIYK